MKSLCFFSCRMLASLLISGSIALAATPPAQPSDTRTPVIRLPELVVTASRSDAPLMDVPYSTERIEGEGFHQRLVRTTPEALNPVSSVMFQKTGHGQGSPYIRGFTGFRTLFLIDGVRLNNSTFRDGPNQYWNTVDPYSLSHLEIVKGPSSVLYGSDAIGGTVQGFSISPPESGEAAHAEGRTFARYSSAEDSYVLRAEGQTSTPKGGIHAGLSLKDFGELRSGSGRQQKTGYEEQDLDVKGVLKLSEQSRIVIAHQTVLQDNAWRTHKTVFAQPYHGTLIGNEKIRSLDQARHLTYLTLENTDLGSALESVYMTASHHRQREDQYRVKSDDSSDLQGTDVDTYGFSIQAAQTENPVHWVSGFEFYHDQVDSYLQTYRPSGELKSIGIQGPVADDSSYDSAGAYLQSTLPVNDHTDLTLGARYNWFHADVGTYENPGNGEAESFTDQWNAWVGSARVLYRPVLTHPLRLFAGLSQGFRAPNLSDLTRFDTARSNEIETPSPDLDSEQYLAFEIGAKIPFERGLLELGYYYTDIQDMIVRTPTGRTLDGNEEVTKKNAGDGYVHGVEISGKLDITEAVFLWGNLSWLEGEVDTYASSAPVKTREPIDRLMPLTGKGGIHWSISSRCWAATELIAAGRQDKLSTRDKADTQRIPPGGTPGYLLVNLRSGMAIRDNLQFTVSLENLANTTYRVHGSGVNEAGRNIVLAMDLTF